MAEYPLLIFPDPARTEKAKRHGGGRPPRIPDAQRQAERLALQLERLHQAMDHRTLTLQDNPLGLQPELALVLETIGSVDRFINSIRMIPGLEWLGESEIESIPPDYGFEDEDDPQKQLRGQMFLVMTDRRALEELQNLFNRWQRDPSTRFPRGLAPLRQAFAHLYTIRPWDDEDRIRETGVFEDWQCRERHGQTVTPFEAELWFRGTPQRQHQAGAYLRSRQELTFTLLSGPDMLGAW